MFCASSQAPAWEFGIGSSSFQSREARASPSGFPSWSLGISENVALPFNANCQVFLDSCLRYQLAFLVNILNVKTDILLSGLEQIGHLLLCQPNGFPFQSHIDFNLSVFGLVNQKLTVFRGSLFFHDCTASSISCSTRDLACSRSCSDSRFACFDLDTRSAISCILGLLKIGMRSLRIDDGFQ